MTEQEYNGLLGEIITEDIYRMRKVDDIVSINDPTYVHWKGHSRAFDFEPDIVFDLGANIGIFSRYARSLYPKCKVIAVEPDERNVAEFRNTTHDDQIILLHNAIGQGQIWHAYGAINGAHECYLSDSLAWKDETLEKSGVVDKSSVKGIMLDTLVGRYLPLNARSVLKLDIEGNEMVIFEHKPSMYALKQFDYIVMELHWNALSAADIDKVKERTLQMMNELRETHNVEYEHIYLYATKR